MTRTEQAKVLLEAARTKSPLDLEDWIPNRSEGEWGTPIRQLPPCESELSVAEDVYVDLMQLRGRVRSIQRSEQGAPGRPDQAWLDLAEATLSAAVDTLDPWKSTKGEN